MKWLENNESQWGKTDNWGHNCIRRVHPHATLLLGCLPRQMVFSKNSSTASSITHVILWNSSHWAVGSMVPPLESGWIRDYGESDTMWFLRLSHKRQYSSFGMFTLRTGPPCCEAHARKDPRGKKTRPWPSSLAELDSWQLEPPCQLWEQAVLQCIPQIPVNTAQVTLCEAATAVPPGSCPD